jgi:hypothetical protein
LRLRQAPKITKLDLLQRWLLKLEGSPKHESTQKGKTSTKRRDIGKNTREGMRTRVSPGGEALSILLLLYEEEKRKMRMKNTKAKTNGNPKHAQPINKAKQNLKCSRHVRDPIPSSQVS